MTTYIYIEKDNRSGEGEGFGHIFHDIITKHHPAYPFMRQSHKMVKQTQTIRRQFADELFECVRPFCEIGA